MRYVIEELGMEVPDSNIIFCVLLQGSLDILKNMNVTVNDNLTSFHFLRHESNSRLIVSFCFHLGFNVTTDACCGFGRYNGWIICTAYGLQKSF